MGTLDVLLKKLGRSVTLETTIRTGPCTLAYNRLCKAIALLYGSSMPGNILLGSHWHEAVRAAAKHCHIKVIWTEDCYEILFRALILHLSLHLILHLVLHLILHLILNLILNLILLASSLLREKLLLPEIHFLLVRVHLYSCVMLVVRIRADLVRATRMDHLLILNYLRVHWAIHLGVKYLAVWNRLVGVRAELHLRQSDPLSSSKWPIAGVWRILYIWLW